MKAKSLIRRVKGVGHKLYVDNFFSSPDLFDDLHTRAVNCCRTVRIIKKMLGDFDSKTLKLKQGNTQGNVKDIFHDCSFSHFSNTTDVAVDHQLFCVFSCCSVYLRVVSVVK
jgi:hypothetical protein